MKMILAAIAIAAVATMGVSHVANADALDDIKKAKKIRIAIDLGVPPYGMTDDKMQPSGSDIDTAKALAKDWGLEFEHVPTTGASRIPVAADRQGRPRDLDAVDHARARQGDRLLAGLRRRCSTVIAATKATNVKKLADLDGKTVGTVRGTTHDTQLTKEGPKGMKLVRYEDDATEAQAFLSGQVDIISTAELLVAPIAKKNPARELEVKFVLDTFKLAVGVKKDEARLLEEVNKWIAAKLKDGTLNAIYKKHHGNDLPDVILKQ